MTLRNITLNKNNKIKNKKLMISLSSSKIKTKYKNTKINKKINTKINKKINTKIYNLKLI
jgi:hypothetical protein